MTWKTAIKISVVILLVSAAVVVTASHFRSHANAKSIAFNSTDQMARYNDLDRQVANLRLQIQIIEGVDKKSIRDSLGVPKEFVERRLDPNSYNSSVVEFVEPPPKADK